MVNVAKHCWNLHHSTFILFIDQMSWKKSLLLTCQILQLLFNPLATDKKYLVLTGDNLTILIQMQLSQKQKTFSQFFPAFFKFRWNLEYFETKHDPHRFFISEISASENVVREMSKNYHFRRPFHKQHAKRAQALLKSASQHLYHIHYHCQVNRLRKGLCFWHAKSWDCLLTHWLPMKLILFLIETI